MKGQNSVPWLLSKIIFLARLDAVGLFIVGPAANPDNVDVVIVVALVVFGHTVRVLKRVGITR